MSYFYILYVFIFDISYSSQTNRTRKEIMSYNSLSGKIIALDGLIGAGKTVLGSSMETYLNNTLGLKARFFEEVVDKGVLAEYIADMKNQAFRFQMKMLRTRLEILEDAKIFSQSGGVSILDRSTIGDMAFARMQKDSGIFTDQEWTEYTEIISKHIDGGVDFIVIYLDCSVDVSMHRIRKRGTESEISGYTKEYLEHLGSSHKESLKLVQNKLCLDWNKDDVVLEGKIRKPGVIKVLDEIIQEFS